MSTGKQKDLPNEAKVARKNAKQGMAKLAGETRVTKEAPDNAKPALATLHGETVTGVFGEDEYEHGNEAQASRVKAFEGDLAKLTKAIEDIGKGVQKLDWEMAALLVGISVRCVCNDKPKEGVDLANSLLEAIGTSVVKRRKIVWWFKKYAPLNYKKDAKGGNSVFEINNKLETMRAEFKKDRHGFVEIRLRNPYSGDEFKAERNKENAAKEFDFNEQLDALLKKAKKLKRQNEDGKLKSFAKVNLGLFDAVDKLMKETKPKAQLIETPKEADTVSATTEGESTIAA